LSTAVSHITQPLSASRILHAIFGSRGGAGGLRKRVSSVDGDFDSEADPTPLRPLSRAHRAPDPRLVCILSTERSGSTLLSMALGANPRHVVPPELHLMAYDSFESWLDDYPQAMGSLRFVLDACGVEADDDEIRATFAGWKPEAVYEWVFDGRLAEGRILVDKTPKYARDPAILEGLEVLKPHYVWLVRHPLGVSASQIQLRRARRARKRTGFVERLKLPLARMTEKAATRELVEKETAYWCACNRNIERFLEGVDDARQERVSYDAFVRDPEPVLRRVCEWLGSEFTESMLSPQEYIPAQMGPEVGDPKIRSHKSIDASVADAWRADVDEAWLNDQARALMRRWGVPTN
jgi:LPS sulfotransferase NodH